MRYLSAQQILLLHSMIVDETGGVHGVRDHRIILSLAELPRQKTFGKEFYKGIFAKAAVLVRGIIEGHPFVDGNKRTAMVVAGVFLEKNGHKIIAKEGEVEKFACKVASTKVSFEAIATWLGKYSRKAR